MTHFADRLVAAIKAKGNPLCVGLDPRWQSLPLEIRQRYGADSLESIAHGFEEFCLRVLDIVAELVPVVKPQSAFFEACGPAGMSALQNVLSRARELGLITILDNKRNDIASTALAYAEAALGGVSWEKERLPVWDADALTINPYLGRDAVEPFLECARRSGCGVFVLVRTSNPGAGQFQDLRIVSETEEAPKTLFMHVAEAVRQWTMENLGDCEFGDVGAVVGATYPEELALLRETMPEVIFLVPGFGAQGGTAKDIAGAFHRDGQGAIINSSRGILFPYKPDSKDWEKQIEVACCESITAILTAVNES